MGSTADLEVGGPGSRNADFGGSLIFSDIPTLRVEIRSKFGPARKPRLRIRTTKRNLFRVENLQTSENDTAPA